MNPALLFAVTFVLAPAAAPARPAGASDPAPLAQLGVTLQVTQRPAWPAAPGTSVDVTLLLQTDPGMHVASFGVPFGPGVLTDDRELRVLGADGQEIPAWTRPLAHWWIDGKKGTIRSVLVQVACGFLDAKPRKVRLVWGRARQRSRPKETPVAETQFARLWEPPRPAAGFADTFEYRCPKVLAVLPPEWLCASLLVWQQVPAGRNKVAAWFDKHLVERFDASLRYVSANARAYEAHLFDRPATYVKVYARHGAAKHLLAAIQAGDFYIRHLREDGFFDLKRYKDVKYVYTEGPALLYLLTGDERYRQAVDRAMKAWATHRRIEYTGRGFWTERHHGFGMLAYLHAYELAGEAAHLTKARRFFEAAYAMQVKPADGKGPDGAWVHTGSSHGDGSGWTTSPWMSAFLADAIWKYWMLSGDDRCPASLAMYAKFIARHAVTPDAKGVYYMANSPGRGKSANAESPPHNVEAVYLLAMGWWLSGGRDAELRKPIETLWPPVMTDGANRPGRKFNWRFRETSMLVWLLAEGERLRAAPGR